MIWRFNCEGLVYDTGSVGRGGGAEQRARFVTISAEDIALAQEWAVWSRTT